MQDSISDVVNAKILRPRPKHHGQAQGYLKPCPEANSKAKLGL